MAAHLPAVSRAAPACTARPARGRTSELNPLGCLAAQLTPRPRRACRPRKPPQRALRNLQTLALLDTLVRPTTWTIAGKAGAAAAGTPAAVSLAQGEGPVLPGSALQPRPQWGRLIGLALVAACLEPSAGRGRAGLWKAGVALHTGTTHYCALWRPLQSFRRNNQAWTLRFSGLGWFTCNADRCRPLLCPPP